jgi:hypothetical protein
MLSFLEKRKNVIQWAYLRTQSSAFGSRLKSAWSNKYVRIAIAQAFSCSLHPISSPRSPAKRRA